MLPKALGYGLKGSSAVLALRYGLKAFLPPQTYRETLLPKALGYGLKGSLAVLALGYRLKALGYGLKGSSFMFE